MMLSLNEVEALAKNAARGAGYSWGLAEEAGKATRWLCAHDVDGCAELAKLLTEQDGKDYAEGAPVLGEIWRSRGHGLCPIATGSALSDHADILEFSPLQMENVARPLLLAPFAGWSAWHLKKTLVLTWGKVRLATDGEALCHDGDGYVARATISVTVQERVEPAAPQSRSARAQPDSESYIILRRLAHRTYAPATETSRLSGAGAGLHDND